MNCTAETESELVVPCLSKQLRGLKMLPVVYTTRGSESP